MQNTIWIRLLSEKRKAARQIKKKKKPKNLKACFYIKY